jgi:predicted metalloprotease with PDZ domain
LKALSAARKREDFSYSLGFSVGPTGALVGVLWDSPAFKAGMKIGTEIVAVNGLAFDADKLKKLITAAKGKGGALEFIVKEGERFRTVSIDYHDGLRYPKLERIPGTPARLDEILTARK